MQRRLLFALLDRVMTRLAERLQVGLIPEQAHITTMRPDVIAHQQRGVDLNPAAARALTRVEIAAEDTQTQIAPARELVPGFPGQLGHLPKGRPRIPRRQRGQSREETSKENARRRKLRLTTHATQKPGARAGLVDGWSRFPPPPESVFTEEVYARACPVRTIQCAVATPRLVRSDPRRVRPGSCVRRYP